MCPLTYILPILFLLSEGRERGEGERRRKRKRERRGKGGSGGEKERKRGRKEGRKKLKRRNTAIALQLAYFPKQVNMNILPWRKLFL